MDWIPYIWAAAGLLMIGAEFLVPGFVIFFFGAGGLLTAGLTALFPALRDAIPLQFLIWAGSSSLSLFALRRFLKPVFYGSESRGEEDDGFTGHQATVVEEIRPGRPGRVRYQGTSWSAVAVGAESIAVDEAVDILKKENLTLVVGRSYLEADE